MCPYDGDLYACQYRLPGVIRCVCVCACVRGGGGGLQGMPRQSQSALGKQQCHQVGVGCSTGCPGVTAAGSGEVGCPPTEARLGRP
jgi:hypothetical protein